VRPIDTLHINCSLVRYNSKEKMMFSSLSSHFLLPQNETTSTIDSTRLQTILKENHCYMCRRFETGGSLSRRVSVLRAPAQMGRARGRARRGERRGGRSRA
jgi:hypothetical protein